MKMQPDFEAVNWLGNWFKLWQVHNGSRSITSIRWFLEKEMSVHPVDLEMRILSKQSRRDCWPDKTWMLRNWSEQVQQSHPKKKGSNEKEHPVLIELMHVLQDLNQWFWAYSLTVRQSLSGFGMLASLSELPQTRPLLRYHRRLQPCHSSTLAWCLDHPVLADATSLQFFRGAPTGDRENFINQLAQANADSLAMDVRMTGWTGWCSLQRWL